MRVLTLRSDEGWCLADAARVYHGEIPYRDFFEIVGPGTFYWVALFFKLFGETWLASRASVLVIGIATVLLLCLLARRLKPGSEIALLMFWFAISFPEWATVSHHLTANLFALAAFAMVLWWLDRAPSAILLVCGVSVGITFATMFPKGLLLCVALTAILLLQRARPRLLAVMQFLGGFTAVLVAGVGYFWTRGSLADACYANFIFPLRNYSDVGAVPYGFGLISQFRNVFAVLVSTVHTIPAFVIASVLCAPLAVVFILPFLLVAMGLYLKSAAFTAKSIPYWIAGSALWLSELHRPDMIHLVFGSPVLLVLLFSLACRRQFLRRSLMAGGAIPATVNMLMCLMAPILLATPVGSVALFARNPIIDFTNSHIRPGESLFIYPYYPTYYFLARAVNPTRFSYLLYGHHTPEQMHEAVEALERDKTRYVVWDTAFERGFARSAIPHYRPPPESERIMEPYLNSRYTEIGRERSIRFLKRAMP